MLALETSWIPEDEGLKETLIHIAYKIHLAQLIRYELLSTELSDLVEPGGVTTANEIRSVAQSQLEQLPCPEGI